MKSVDKNRLIESLAAMTDQHLTEAIRTFQNLPPEVLLKPPAGGGWSAAQCMEHLNLYGRYYLPQIKAALIRAKSKANNSEFKSSWLGDYFTKMMLPDSGKKKIKAFRDYIPNPALDAAAVTAEFIVQLELLMLYLREAKQIDLAASRIPISIAKFVRLKAGDVFQFVIAHNERHVRQMKRALAVVG